MEPSLSDKSFSAFIWVLIDKLGGSTINFILTIILARLLSPEDFGLVAMVMILFDVSSVFIESGFSSALIREKTISEVDKSTVFIFNLTASVLLFAILFVFAPNIAVFFGNEQLVWIIRIMGFSLVISSFGIIQTTTLTQQIDFETQTKIRFTSVIISGICGVTLAFLGFGVWALVAKMVTMILASTLLLWVKNPWKPTGTFSIPSFKRLFGFSSKILVIAVIDKFYSNIYQLLIGKYFSVTTLGFYKQADNFRSISTNTLLQTIQRVTYPVLAKLQHDRKKQKEGYRRIMKMSSFVMIPAMVLLAILAKPVILTLVGAKWEPAVIFLQLLCIAGITSHFNSLNYNMLMVLGRVDLSLRLEVINKVNITIAVIAGIQFGIMGLVVGHVIASYFELFINSFYSRKLLGYPLLQQFKDNSSSLLFSLLTGLLIFGFKFFIPSPHILVMFVGLAFGGTFYCFLHFLARTEEMDIIRQTILPKVFSLVSSFSGRRQAA